MRTRFAVYVIDSLAKFEMKELIKDDLNSKGHAEEAIKYYLEKTKPEVKVRFFIAEYLEE